LQAARLSVFVLTLAERGLLMHSKGALFPLRSAWSLRLASSAHGQVEELQSGETVEIPYSAAPGLGATLGLALFGVRPSLIVIVRKDSRTPLSAALGFLLFVGVLRWVVIRRAAFSKLAAP
jgi:hypothetical protein